MKIFIRWARTTALDPVKVFCPCILGLLIIGQVTYGQLGRGPKRSDPAPTTTSEPGATSTSRVAKTAPVLVMAAEYIPSQNVAFETGIAYRSLLARFQESSRVSVTAQKEMRRKDAIDLAKSKTDAYVVWLQLEIDLMGSADAHKDTEKASVSTINPSCLFVTYAVFA